MTGFRAMIYYDYKKGLTVQECIVLLITSFDNSACSRVTVLNWFADFRGGRVSLRMRIRLIGRQ